MKICLKLLSLILLLLLSFNKFLNAAQENSKAPDLQVLEMKHDEGNQKDLEQQIQKVTPKQFSKGLVGIAEQIASLIPPEKLEEVFQQINKVMIEEIKKNPQGTEYKKIAPKVNKIIVEMLRELEYEKSLNTYFAKLRYAAIILKKNLTIRQVTKTTIYRFVAALDVVFMTYIFITHNISLAQVLQLGAFDFVTKFILLYLYDTIWQAQCCNTIWSRLKCCKKDESSDDESEEEEQVIQEEHHQS